MLKVQLGAKKWISVLTVMLLLMMSIPSAVFADSSNSGSMSSMQFVWDSTGNSSIGGSNSNVIVGVVNTQYFNLQFKLLENGVPVVGVVTATVKNPDGVVNYCDVSGTKNNYTVTNLSLDAIGTYTINLTNSQGNTAVGYVLSQSTIPQARVNITGSLVSNTFSTVTVKLTDLQGVPLSKGAVTLDASAVGAGQQTYTTLNDGTFSFAMTPTQSGLVKIIYGNVVIGGIEVASASSNIHASVTGSLYVNAESTITVKLTDAVGNPLERKSVTIDGTDVNASPVSQTYTTLNDGTFVFKITPSQTGVVKIVYGGDIVGTIPVNSQSLSFSYTGSLVANTTSSVTVKLTDPSGHPLQRKTGTVDGSDVKASPAVQSFTTLNDGSFVFTMTPTQMGIVKVIYGGDVVGTIDVSPAFTWKYRIGSQAPDNVALSIDVVEQGWKSANNIILTRDDQFSDAMAAVPLSKKLDAPILMTNSISLDSRTSDEIRILGATNVYIVGGTVAISQAIQDSLDTEFTVTRIAGPQGYDTATQISTYVGIDDTHTVYLANGHAIPDAIAISAFAAEQGSPILLTDRDELPPSTMKALADLNVKKVILLGGTAVIGKQVENLLGSNYLVKRWGGYDRYDTQNIIFQNLFNNSQTQTPQSPLFFTSGLVRQDDVSSGKPYADALVTAALAAKTDGFVAMLTPNQLPSSLSYFLYNNIGYISKSAIVGNFEAVSSDVQSDLEYILRH